MVIVTVTVEAVPDPIESHEVAAVTVTTEDATGTEREYHISLGVDGLMAGLRIDNYNPARDPWPDGPSDTAWEAATEAFRELGFDPVSSQSESEAI